jgi:peptidase M48-like protein
VTDAALAGIAVIVVYAAVAPGLGRRLPPATATRLLASASFFVAASGGFILAVIAFTWVGQYPDIAERGAWSTAVLRTNSPPATAAAICGALVLLAAISATVTLVRRVRALVGVYGACRGLTAPGGVVVLDDPRPEAFTTPRPIGRVVVTTGLLGALRADERRTLLAHERSHLAHHHAWWRLVADVAAAANPLLRPASRSVATAVERWADEDAARTVGNRRLVARTLAHVALLQTAAARSSAQLAATGGDIASRVRALLAPAPRRRPMPLVALIALVVSTALPAAAVQHTGENLFENAASQSASQSTG